MGSTLVYELGHILAVNALLAILVAVLVAILCKRTRIPAVRHVLWLLVLARLVLPPIWVFDLTPSLRWVHECFEIQAMRQPDWSRNANTRLWAWWGTSVQESTRGLLPTRSLFPKPSSDDQSVSSQKATANNDPSPSTDQPTLWQTGSLLARYLDFLWRTYLSKLLAFVWILGAIFCATFQVIAAWQFWRRLKHSAYTSGIWQRRVAKLASNMFCSRTPAVKMVREPISPMLWGFGYRAQILLPDRLMTQLDRRGQDGLLCHELAHYRRGDHWVRMLEALVLPLFWWHPVFWWTRYELSKAEEEACDLTAIRQTCGDRRTYAEALLRAIDFVSLQPLAPTACSAVSHGMLRLRLQQIMTKQNRTFQTPSICLHLFLLFAIALLPYPKVSPQQIFAKPPPTTSSVQQADSPNARTHQEDDKQGNETTSETPTDN